MSVELEGDCASIPTYYEVMDEYYKEIAEKDASVLRKAKKYLGNKRYNQLLEQLEYESLDDSIWLVDVVKESTVNKRLRQDYDCEDLNFCNYHYVSQSTGYICDDYHGRVWLPISGRKRKHRMCLVFDYQC